MLVCSGRIWKLKWKRSWEHVTNYFDFCQADNRIFPYRWLSETPLTTALLRGITLHRPICKTNNGVFMDHNTISAATY